MSIKEEAGPGPILAVFVPNKLARLLLFGSVVLLLAAARLLLASILVLKRSFPVKLVFRTRRVRFPRVTFDLALFGPP